MPKKNTIAAIKIRQEMKERSLTGANLAELANLPYYAVENILSGKSSKLDKLEAIAKVLGKPLMYFVNADYDEKNIGNNSSYDGELHYKVVKIIHDICTKNKIYLNKDRMDQLTNFIYPRLKKDDPENLIIAQTEAIINYVVKNNIKIT